MKNTIEKDAMITRKSIRTFTGEKLSVSDKNLILDYINHVENRFSFHENQIRIQLIEVDERRSDKIGTYGIIKNAPAFLVVSCKNDRDSLFDCGYVVERMALYLAQNGLGTCWLGGTFHRAKLVEKVSLLADEIIPVILPVGYGDKKRSLSDKMIRSLAKGDSRLPFDKLFFYENFMQKILDSDLRGELQLVRLAPSASNKQPWRILMDENGHAHFYLKRTSKYAASLSYDIQWLDMGISAAHYEIACGGCEFLVDDAKLIHGYLDLEYVITAKRRV
ncbi:nitroreductase family protein [Gottschalkiaceae bacterium SANA]|nr:nitroreductase family protein [Gottschalkiaceae bacterium SANA]